MSTWKENMRDLTQKPNVRLVEEDKLISVGYEKDEFVHRNPELGPSYFWFHSNGNLMSVAYIQKGVRINRDPTDGPASFIYHEDGSLRIENYITNGKYHRPDIGGRKMPVSIEYAQNGDIINQRYY